MTQLAHLLALLRLQSGLATCLRQTLMNTSRLDGGAQTTSGPRQTEGGGAETGKRKVLSNEIVSPSNNSFGKPHSARNGSSNPHSFPGTQTRSARFLLSKNSFIEIAVWQGALSKIFQAPFGKSVNWPFGREAETVCGRFPEYRKKNKPPCVWSSTCSFLLFWVLERLKYATPCSGAWFLNHTQNFHYH